MLLPFITLVLLIIFGPLLYRWGLNRGLNRGIASVTYKHQHIWGPWKKSWQEIYSHGEKVTEISIQIRHCDECNYGEAEEFAV